MLRLAGRRFSSLPRRSSQATFTFVHRSHPLCTDVPDADDFASSRSVLAPYRFSFTRDLIRGFSSDAFAPGHDLVRLLILKFVLSMSASKDVLALASLEVDLSSIEPGTTITVKWRGKPVFIRRRTEEDIKLANSVDVASPVILRRIHPGLRIQNGLWIRKGPAPYNLEVPTYSFLDENKLLIG
ncbi:hypothetical protein GH714_027029 [Hevea brasiliensis]|uniref:Cytochrome b-c1 complex subunit Rieske transmembrane domain-containing protein n=1 Tax=Hevea brasiliensis TaxID=3981 RepID=A0A6A6M4H4_HEVBR|nr:hypothetical protein GH714_027029 [Hevea brasiliensis]